MAWPKPVLKVKSMQLNRYIAIFGLLNALTLSAIDNPASAGQGKQASVSRGEKAKAKISDKGKINTNAQWSADPDHGWVRAEERHDLRSRRKSDAGSRPNRDKQKGKSEKAEQFSKKGTY